MQNGKSFLKRSPQLIDISPNSNMDESNNNTNTDIIMTPKKNDETSVNYLRFFERKPLFMQTLNEKINENDIKQILVMKKLRRNITCEEVDDLLQKSQILLDSIESSNNIEIFQDFLVSLRIIKKLIKKVLEIEKGDPETRSEAYESFILNNSFF